MTFYKFTPYTSLFGAFILALTAIMTALALEQAGFMPCSLCLEQRIPYYVGVPILALLNFFMVIGIWRKRTLTSIMVYAVMLIFVCSFYMGAYHTGVEWGIWDGPSSCSVFSMPKGSGAHLLLKQVKVTKFVSCNNHTFTVLGVSLATLNACVSIVVIGLLYKFETRSV